jgi:hypothetical protein
MSTTVAAIALEVFTALAEELPDVVKTCTLTKTVQGAYNATTGTYSTTTSTAGGQAIITTGGSVEGVNSTIRDNHPDYVRGPTDVVMILRGLSLAPQKNDTITIGSAVWIVTLALDVVGVGELYIVVAMPKA